MTYVYLVLAFCCNAAANIFLKSGAMHGVDLSSWNPFLFVTKNSSFTIGTILFACNALLYFLALRTLPLLVAYPVMVAMSFIIVAWYAAFGFGEYVSLVLFGLPTLVLWGVLFKTQKRYADFCLVAQRIS